MLTCLIYFVVIIEETSSQCSVSLDNPPEGSTCKPTTIFAKLIVHFKIVVYTFFIKSSQVVCRVQQLNKTNEFLTNLFVKKKNKLSRIS